VKPCYIYLPARCKSFNLLNTSSYLNGAMAGTSSGSRFTLFVDCLLFLYTISPYPLHRCVPINSDGEQCPLIPMVIQVATDTPLSRRTNVIYLSCTGTPLSTRVKSRFVGVMPRPQTPIITNLLDKTKTKECPLHSTISRTRCSRPD
jgi:hypothetical protein